MNTYSYNGYRSGWMEGEPFHPLGNVDVDMDGSFRYYLRYLNVNADIRVSLLGLIRQRDLTSQMHDLQAYAGVGYAHFFRYRGTTKANAFTGHLGLRYRVRVHERVDVNLDGTVGLLPSHMHPTRHPYASTLAFSVGCTYHIGQRIFRRAIERIPVETVRYRTDTVLVREVPMPGEERIIERIVAPRSENTAMAIIRFRSGAMGNIVVSNSQNPALCGNVRVHGSNGASAGVQTDGGAMFIAGMSTITEPPVNDLWTVPGEAEMLPVWKQEDSDFFNSVDSMYYYHREQVNDFLNAVLTDTKPLVDGRDGRRTVELFEAIYRSTRTNSVIKFPIR